MDGQLKGHLKNKKKKQESKKGEKQVLNLRKIKREWEKDRNEEINVSENVLNKYEILAPLLSSEYWQTYLAKEK